MSHSRQKNMAKRKRRIQSRLRIRVWAHQKEPMFKASNIHYEVAERTRGLGAGGIGAMHLLARRTGRRIVFRLLAWNPWQEVFFRAVDALRTPLRC